MVKLIVEILEPYHGKILDPASGSGGMFVQSARFVSEHQQNPNAEISVYGQERVAARGSEQNIRRQMIEARTVDVMVAAGSNFFYTVTLPCTLWFLDRVKATDKKHRNRDHVLFLDARHIFRQIDRAIRLASPGVAPGFRSYVSARQFIAADASGALGNPSRAVAGSPTEPPVRPKV